MIDSGEQVAYLLCAGGVRLPVAGVAARMLWQRSSRKQAANLQRAVAQIACGTPRRDRLAPQGSPVPVIWHP